jgi:type VII secretion-associated serine protease mycosin
VEDLRTAPRLSRSKILSTGVALATGLALAMSVAPAHSAPVDPEAARILAGATAGEPVTVVTTTQTADGPTFSTEVADSRKEALGLISEALDEPAVAAVDIAHPVSIAGKRSNDTYRPQQWALNKLKAEKNWRKSTGKGVVVAVIDTGVRANHPDLRGRVKKGWDFVSSDNSASDLNGHGTHVAGAIAAKKNNRRGIAGLAPSAKILPVRVLDANGNGNTLAVARGIVYAVNKGADVINLSLAGDRPDGQTRAAVAYAVRKNVVVVAAAGNRGCGASATYPAAYPNVIGVGAIDRYSRVDGYSQCGSYVDVVAPGSSIASTMIYRSHPALGCGYGTSYCRLSGTSMAAPYAAASAALLISRTKGKLRASKVRRIMTVKASNIGPRGRDAASGHGLVNPWRMMAGR